MRLPPFGNPYRKTRVGRGTQIWAGIKHVNRSIGLSLQRRYVIITLVIEFVIFCLISSCPRPIIISLRWMIDHLVFITAMAPGIVEGPMDPTKNYAVKTVDIRNLSYVIGVLAAAATLPFTMIRVWINERNAQATKQGLVTNRINTAVAGLGTEKTVKDRAGVGTVREYSPQNLEVRIGVIMLWYASPKIATGIIRTLWQWYVPVSAQTPRRGQKTATFVTYLVKTIGLAMNLAGELPDMNCILFNIINQIKPCRHPACPCEPLFRPGSA